MNLTAPRTGESSHAPPGCALDLEAKRGLTPDHLREIHEESGVPLEDITDRYWSVSTPDELLALGFADWQAKHVPGYVVALHDPLERNGHYSFKADTPRVSDGRPVKYDFPIGSQPILDIPRRCLESVHDAEQRLLFTEGAKKADCAAGLGYAVVNCWGVHNWSKRDHSRTAFDQDGEPSGLLAIEDWQHIPLDGRYCSLCFDSDAWTKPNVGLALRRLANWLTRQGALVSIVHLPDAEDGSKLGLDDYVTRYGAEAFEQLVDNAEPWGSIAMVRKLQAEIQDLKRQLHSLAQMRRDSSVNSTDLRVGWAVADELGWRRSRGQNGPVEVNLTRMSDQAGVSSDTVGAALKRFVEVPDTPIWKKVVWRETDNGERHKVILLDTPKRPDAGAGDILHALVPAMPRKRAQGGIRTPRCPDHIDAVVMQREHLLHFSCGCVIDASIALMVEVDDVKPQLAVLPESEVLGDPDEPDSESKTATCGFTSDSEDGSAEGPSPVVKKTQVAVLADRPPAKPSYWPVYDRGEGQRVCAGCGGSESWREGPLVEVKPGLALHMDCTAPVGVAS